MTQSSVGLKNRSATTRHSDRVRFQTIWKQFIKSCFEPLKRLRWNRTLPGNDFNRAQRLTAERLEWGVGYRIAGNRWPPGQNYNLLFTLSDASWVFSPARSTSLPRPWTVLQAVFMPTRTNINTAKIIRRMAISFPWISIVNEH